MTPDYTTGSGIALMRQSQGEKGFGDSEEGKDREEEQPLREDGRVPIRRAEGASPCAKWKDTE